MMRPARYPTSMSSQPPTRPACPTFHAAPSRCPNQRGITMSATVLEQLLELQQRPRGAEVLIDAGAVLLGEGEQWVRVCAVRPSARFQVAVKIRGHGEAHYRPSEIRGVREFGHV